jgi:hypothetical protein
MITHILQDTGVADKLRFVVPNHMLSMQSLGPLHHCEAASPSIAPVYHVRDQTIYGIHIILTRQNRAQKGHTRPDTRRNLYHIC